ncbi:MAG: twin transmembrane helix small protein [Micavibrio sp.]
MSRLAHYLIRMSGFFFTLMIIAMLATLAILCTGILSMMKGGEFNRKYGNKLMRARVFMQGIALACFALAILSAG